MLKFIHFIAHLHNASKNRERQELYEYAVGGRVIGIHLDQNQWRFKVVRWHWRENQASFLEIRFQ